MLGIYLHIPFCAKVCDYCDFHVMPAHSRLFQEYVDLLCSEIRAFDERHPGRLASAETLYLGGGTPSMLPAGCVTQIFDCLRDAGVRLGELREISMEFNPESVTEEAVYNAMACGVNRISLGLQTFDPSLLKTIGRAHTVERGLAALEFLTGLGGGSQGLQVSGSQGLQVSGDLMFDLPTQTVEGFLSDVDRLSDYPLNHISFYGLTVNPRTVLGQKVARGDLKVDEDVYEAMYQGGVDILQRKGFARYEVSNFARPGFESVHNRNYWDRGEYAGFGPGAHSFLGSRRFYAPEIYPRWRDYVKAGSRESDLTVDALSADDVLSELIWLSMRQARGLDLQDIENLGLRLMKNGYSKWLSAGYLVETTRAVPTPATPAVPTPATPAVSTPATPAVPGLGCAENHRFLQLSGRGWIFMDDIVTDLMNSSSNLE